MTKTINKITKKGHSYYTVLEETWVNGKPVRKYVGYLGKSPKSKNEIEPELLLQYVHRLIVKGISQEEIDQILKKIGIDYDAWPITKIIVENDLKLKKVFLKLK
ncbi:hypothetical protein B1A_06858 [mine drainage metagenome]|uniref:Uncharacterized protein n=1 Tax=mine drainage metagenome TaxID=410659 RepID=T1A9H6_9ZZZZ